MEDAELVRSLRRKHGNRPAGAIVQPQEHLPSFARLHKKCSSNPFRCSSVHERDPGMKTVTLCIGGTTYATTCATLLCVDSFFTSMLSGLYEGPRTSSGDYFVDRDGKAFRHILEYLRARYYNDDSYDLPAIKGSALRSLLAEARFYQLADLVRLLEAKLGAEDGSKAQAAADRAQAYGPLVDSVYGAVRHSAAQFPQDKVDALVSEVNHGMAAKYAAGYSLQNVNCGIVFDSGEPRAPYNMYIQVLLLRQTRPGLLPQAAVDAATEQLEDKVYGLAGLPSPRGRSSSRGSSHSSSSSYAAPASAAGKVPSWLSTHQDVRNLTRSSSNSCTDNSVLITTSVAHADVSACDAQQRRLSMERHQSDSAALLAALTPEQSEELMPHTGSRRSHRRMSSNSDQANSVQSRHSRMHSAQSTPTSVQTSIDYFDPPGSPRLDYTPSGSPTLVLRTGETYSLPPTPFSHTTAGGTPPGSALLSSHHLLDGRVGLLDSQALISPASKRTHALLDAYYFQGRAEGHDQQLPGPEGGDDAPMAPQTPTGSPRDSATSPARVTRSAVKALFSSPTPSEADTDLLQTNSDFYGELPTPAKRTASFADGCNLLYTQQLPNIYEDEPALGQNLLWTQCLPEGSELVQTQPEEPTGAPPVAGKAAAGHRSSTSAPMLTTAQLLDFGNDLDLAPAGSNLLATSDLFDEIEFATSAAAAAEAAAGTAGAASAATKPQQWLRNGAFEQGSDPALLTSTEWHGNLAFDGSPDALCSRSSSLAALRLEHTGRPQQGQHAGNASDVSLGCGSEASSAVSAQDWLALRVAGAGPASETASAPGSISGTSEGKCSSFLECTSVSASAEGVAAKAHIQGSEEASIASDSTGAAIQADALAGCGQQLGGKGASQCASQVFAGGFAMSASAACGSPNRMDKPPAAGCLDTMAWLLDTARSTPGKLPSARGHSPGQPAIEEHGDWASECGEEGCMPMTSTLANLTELPNFSALRLFRLALDESARAQREKRRQRAQQQQLAYCHEGPLLGRVVHRQLA